MRTWLMQDLANLVSSGTELSMASALLTRIVREADEIFEAGGSLRIDRASPTKDKTSDAVEAMVTFTKIQHSAGHPQVKLEVRYVERRFDIRVGGRPNSAVLGFSYELAPIDPTPPDLFVALFACAIESAKTQNAVK
jgi:hypothetical protein